MQKVIYGGPQISLKLGTNNDISIINTYLKYFRFQYKVAMENAFLNFLSNRRFFTRFYYNIVLSFINEMAHFSDSFKLNILIMYSVDHVFSISLKLLKN